MNNARAMKLSVTHSSVTKGQLQQDIYFDKVFAFQSPNLWLNIVFYWIHNITKKIPNTFQNGALSTDIHASSMRSWGEKKWLNVETTVFPCSCQIFSVVLWLFEGRCGYWMSMLHVCILMGVFPHHFANQVHLQVVASSADMRRLAKQDVDHREVNRWNFTWGGDRRWDGQMTGVFSPQRGGDGTAGPLSLTHTHQTSNIKHCYFSMSVSKYSAEIILSTKQQDEDFCNHGWICDTVGEPVCLIISLTKNFGVLLKHCLQHSHENTNTHTHLSGGVYVCVC